MTPKVGQSHVLLHCYHHHRISEGRKGKNKGGGEGGREGERREGGRERGGREGGGEGREIYASKPRP